MDINLTIPHLYEFVLLWTDLNNVLLREEVDDTITWNLTENGEYTSSSAYKAQFFGAITSPMSKAVWKAWGPQKSIFLHGWPV